MTKYSSQSPTGLPLVVDLPDVAKSAGWLAEWMLDRPVSAEAEAYAETISAFLRQLTEDAPADDSPRARIDRNVGAECPAWCHVDHTGPRLMVERSEGMRECATGAEEIPTLTGQTVSASVVQFTDLINGTRRQPEVRIGDDTLTPVDAIAYAEQIRDAAISALAPTLIGTEKPTARCASWCTRDHVADGEGAFDDGSQLHESPITTIHGFRDADSTDVKFRANLRVESFESGDGSYGDPPVVWLDIEPVDRPTVNDADADKLSPAVMRHLAARALSGAMRGQAVDLPPAVAIMLGRALVQYGEMAERA